MTNHAYHRSVFRRLTPFLSVIIAALFMTPAKAQNAAIPPELTALLDRAAIQDLLVDYYAQIGTDNHDYSRFFTANGTLDVNGLVATGKAEITALYDRAGGDAGEPPSRPENAAPPGRFNMVMSNQKIAVQGDAATATLLWYSIVAPTLIAPPGVTEHGHERTELVKQDGRWLISRRVVTSDGGMPEGLLQYYGNSD